MSDMNGDPAVSKTGGRMWPLLVGLPLMALLAIGAVVLFGGGESTSRSGGQPSGGNGPVEQPSRPSGGAGEEQASGDAKELGTPALGREDAPVVMVEYSDYQ